MTNMLYISDLDGTLLDNNASLSHSAKKRLNRLIECGLHFSIITSRGRAWTTGIIKDLELTLPFAVYNGALIITKSGEPLNEVYFIPRDIVSNLIDITREKKLNIMAATPDRVYKTLELTTTGKIISFSFIGTKDAITELYSEIKDRYTDSVSMNFFTDIVSGSGVINIISPRANKGNALQQLGKICGFKKENLVVFGNDDLDLPMLTNAGTKVVVNTASPGLLAVADMVIEYNNGKGVIEYMEKIMGI